MTALNRREFLGASAVSAAAILTHDVTLSADGNRNPSESRRPSPKIDCHTHFYDPTRPQGVPWPGKDNKQLYRRMLPADFKAVAAPHGVTGTVVVEASPWVEDNQWLLDLAADEPFIVGIVGNLTPGSDDFAKHVDRFSKNRLFRGIRVSHNGLKAGLESRAYVADLQRLADADCALDVNGGPDLLPTAAKLAREIPRLRVVINHVANVAIDGKAPPREWQEGIRAAAERENTFCKVSALVEGAGRTTQPAPEDLTFYTPVLDVVWNAFGENRLIYGSNWPVSERYAPYATVHSLVAKYVEAKGAAAADKFFATNAQAAYKWVDRS